MIKAGANIHLKNKFMAKKEKAPLSVAVVENTPTEKVIVLTDKVDTLHFKLCIDQVGADVDGAVTERLEFEAKVNKVGTETIELDKLASRLGLQIWAVIRHLKTKQEGFNVAFYVDNNLTADYSLKTKGNLRFTNPRNTIFAVLGILAANFDDANAEGYITGKFNQCPELTLLGQRIGLKKGNLPWLDMEPIVDMKRRKNIREAREEVKAAQLN
jgi:hypothetical protein